MPSATVGYLTSASLIDTIKREGMIPTAQQTFTEADFLAMANQEMRVGLVPSILQYHEEYYVRDSVPIPLVANQNTYPIPYRAVGGKFREVFYLDTNMNLRSMTRISPDDRPYYQQTNFQNRFIYFYIAGNEIVLVPDVGENPVGTIMFSFYIRPNELVDQSRVATIQSINTVKIAQGAISNIASGNPSVLTSIAHGLSTGAFLTIFGSNSNPLIDGNWMITVIDADHFSIPTIVTIPGSQAEWVYNTTTFTMDQIPTGFTTNVLFDVMQTNPGHKTIAFDVSPLGIDNVGMTMTFDTDSIISYSIPPNIGTSPVVGDYISFAGECIIPQAPSDLHDVLAQRVVLRCLQALGDKDGYGVAQSKLTEMERYTATLVDTRSEGSARKVNNLRGGLRSSKLRKRGWL